MSTAVNCSAAATVVLMLRVFILKQLKNPTQHTHASEHLPKVLNPKKGAKLAYLTPQSTERHLKLPAPSPTQMPPLLRHAAARGQCSTCSTAQAMSAWIHWLLAYPHHNPASFSDTSLSLPHQPMFPGKVSVT